MMSSLMEALDLQKTAKENENDYLIKITSNIVS